MKKQKVCLTSLLIYIKEVMTENDLSSTFFLRFMTYLNSESHLCECSACKKFLSQLLKVSDSAADSSISTDLTHYNNSDFKFTDEEWSNLWDAIMNHYLSMNMLWDVSEYFQRLNTTMNEVM